MQRIATTYSIVDSPIGDLYLTFDDTSLTGLYVSDHPVVARLAIRDDGHKLKPVVEEQFNEYWKGTLTEFSIPLAPRGTDWQATVWKELAKVPYGRTITYAELARRIGRPRSARAVGSANARNPISILIPCHRVVATSGSLTGYAGGLTRKAWLLKHEGAVI